MSGIAEVLLATNFEVTGSDVADSPTVKRLRALGARISIGHAPEHVGAVDGVVVSSAVSPDNPEWREARRQGIPVIARAEMLAELMRLKLGIAIAGSHGKTTTTSMVGHVLLSLDPTVVVGGRLQHWDASSLVGKSELFVIEADESDRSFLKFSPIFSVVTNIDREHLDTYRDLEDLKKTFLDFLNRTAFFGRSWISADCEHLRSLAAVTKKPVTTYGFSEEAEMRIVDWSLAPRGSTFSLSCRGQIWGPFHVPIAGEHNIKNAAAAVSVALHLGLDVKTIQENLSKFVPADRRLQVHIETPRVAVVEDYGHHPTEISATLRAVRVMYPERKIHVVFQPHRFSRTQALWAEFLTCFSGADRLWILPIYAAHEPKIEGVTSEKLVSSLVHPAAKAVVEGPALAELLSEGAGPVTVLVLGAGPLTPYARGLVDSIRG